MIFGAGAVANVEPTTTPEAPPARPRSCRMRHMTGAALRRLRKARGLSVAKAAAMIHVSPRTWVRYETLRKVPELPAHLFRLLLEKA